MLARVRTKPSAIIAARGRANRNRRIKDDVVRAFLSGAHDGHDAASAGTSAPHDGHDAAGAAPPRPLAGKRLEPIDQAADRRTPGDRVPPERHPPRRPDQLQSAQPRAVAGRQPEPLGQRPRPPPATPRAVAPPRRGAGDGRSARPGPRRTGGGCPGRSRTTTGPPRPPRGGPRRRAARRGAGCRARRLVRGSGDSREGAFLGRGTAWSRGAFAARLTLYSRRGPADE